MSEENPFDTIEIEDRQICQNRRTSSSYMFLMA